MVGRVVTYLLDFRAGLAEVWGLIFEFWWEKKVVCLSGGHVAPVPQWHDASGIVALPGCEPRTSLPEIQSVNRYANEPTKCIFFWSVLRCSIVGRNRRGTCMRMSHRRRVSGAWGLTPPPQKKITEMQLKCQHLPLWKYAFISRIHRPKLTRSQLKMKPVAHHEIKLK